VTPNRRKSMETSKDAKNPKVTNQDRSHSLDKAHSFWIKEFSWRSLRSLRLHPGELFDEGENHRMVFLPFSLSAACTEQLVD
jgi:hypothetical protein